MGEPSFCESCGAELHPGAHFCGNCGHLVPSSGEDVAPSRDATATRPAEASAAAATPAPPPPPPPVTVGAAPAADAGGPRVPLAIVLGGAALILAIVAVVLVIVLSGGGDDKTALVVPKSQNDALLEPIGEAVPNPFTRNVTAAPETRVNTNALPANVPARAASGGTVDGSAPGLYGGSGNAKVCDPDQLVAFLEANPAKARAWAGALGIPVTSIRSYVARLTPVLLTRDTLVTNHGFRNGKASPRLAVLQAGTAVMVDDYGIPRVKCGCGNPLDEAKQTPRRVVGPRWPGFTTGGITVVIANVQVSSFTIVDIHSGTLSDRPVGTDGSADGEVLVDTLCQLVPDDPSCVPTTTPTVAPPSATTPPSDSGTAFNTPEAVIGESLSNAGFVYIGDCSRSSEADIEIGAYCSILQEDNGTYRVYAIGPVYSEPNDTVNVALQDGYWVVVD